MLANFEMQRGVAVTREDRSLDEPNKGRAPVLLLLSAGSPSDVPRLVAAHVVYAVDGGAFRATPNMLIERLKRGYPLRKNCDPSTSPPRIVLVVWVHAYPVFTHGH